MSCVPEQKLFIASLMLSTELFSRITHYQGPHRITKTKPNLFQSQVPKSQEADRRPQEQNKAGTAGLPGSVQRMDIFGKEELVFRERSRESASVSCILILPPWSSSSHSRVLELFLYFFLIPPASKIESRNMPQSI